MKTVRRITVFTIAAFLGMFIVATPKADATPPTPCVDVTLNFYAPEDPADKVFCVEGPVASEILSYRGVVDELGHRYSDLWSESHTTITNLNFHVAELEGEVMALHSKIDRKNAKIAELRDRIRALQS